MTRLLVSLCPTPRHFVGLFCRNEFLARLFYELGKNHLYNFLRALFKLQTDMKRILLRRFVVEILGLKADSMAAGYLLTWNHSTGYIIKVRRKIKLLKLRKFSSQHLLSNLVGSIPSGLIRTSLATSSKFGWLQTV